MLSPPYVPVNNAIVAPSFNFEQLLSNYCPFTAHFLNNATASPLPEKSNSQPYKAVKESTVMQNSFNSKVSTESNSGPHSTANPSPEVQTSSDSASLNRDKVVPINSAVESANEVSFLRSELKFTQQQLESMRATLLSLQAEMKDIRYADQRMSDRFDRFEQSQQQTQINQNKIRHAQDQQLERRLQDFIKDAVARTMHNAIQKFVRARNAEVPEPARMPSTYSVPKRTNTGIYS